MTRLRGALDAASLLGIGAVARVAVHRLALRTALHPVCRLQSQIADGPFFPTGPRAVTPSPGIEDRIEVRLFGWIPLPLSGEPPDWHRNVLSNRRLNSEAAAWWRIPDFDPGAGDIKGVWEPSRFAWVVPFAQRIASGDMAARDRLDHWIRDWCSHNPPYRGPNWKCGQEASIRVMHLAAAAIIMGVWSETGDALSSLLRAHLQRIASTISYGLAQNNNHGTSEAAALFIGGSWLRLSGLANGSRWERLGRRWLEDRVQCLIAEDGTFSQYSVNYHRMVLDTLSLAEIWRAKTAREPFSESFYERGRAATTWLWNLVDRESGDAPNLGANDGAWLLPLADADFRDYRPSVQVAAALFHDATAYDTTAANAPLQWLGVRPSASSLPQPASTRFDDGGIAVLRSGTATAVVRYPRFRYRPGHADALHLDLWIDGLNHLRDGGSYLYGSDDGSVEYFAGTSSHNTVQVDGRDQMPRLGRFLFGEWLAASEVAPVKESDDGVSFAASYRDYEGALHHRHVSLGTESLDVEDVVAGFRSSAVVRWRLMPGDWRLDGSRARLGPFELEIRSSVPITRMELVRGWESRYYGSKTPLPVLEVEVNEPGSIWTRFAW
jgi:hypothetical protein